MRTRPRETGRMVILQANFYRIHLLVISFPVTHNPRASTTPAIPVLTAIFSWHWYAWGSSRDNTLQHSYHLPVCLMFKIAFFMQLHRKMEQMKDAKSETNKKRRKRNSIKAQTIFFLWFRQEAAFINWLQWDRVTWHTNTWSRGTTWHELLIHAQHDQCIDHDNRV